MRMIAFVSTLSSLGLLCVSTCNGGIFISTNNYQYFSPSQQAQLQLTNALAADGGSDFIIAVEPNGQVTNYYSSPFPVNPPAGLSNVVAISVPEGGRILVLTGSGTVASWALESPQPPDPWATWEAGLSNVVAISSGDSEGLALLSDGTVTSSSGTTLPTGLSNVVAIDAGDGDIALNADGTVVTWGTSISPPADLTNVVAISSWREGFLALRADGTLIGWDSGGVHTNLLLSGITNTVAISGAPDQFLALQSDGSLVVGGTAPLVSFAEPLANVFYLGRMSLEAAVVVEGGGEAHFTVQPGNQIIGQGGTIYLHARAVGESLTQYQWQFNGTNIPGATNGDLIITNASSANAGSYHALISFNLDFTPYVAESAVAVVTVLPPPAQIPALLGVPRLQPDGSFTVSANATNGATFSLDNSSFLVQESTDLINWVSVTNGWSLTNGNIEFKRTGNSAEYYRLASP